MAAIFSILILAFSFISTFAQLEMVKVVKHGEYKILQLHNDVTSVCGMKNGVNTTIYDEDVTMNTVTPANKIMLYGDFDAVSYTFKRSIIENNDTAATLIETRVLLNLDAVNVTEGNNGWSNEIIGSGSFGFIDAAVHLDTEYQIISFFVWGSEKIVDLMGGETDGTKELMPNTLIPGKQHANPKLFTTEFHVKSFHECKSFFEFKNSAASKDFFLDCNFFFSRTRNLEAPGQSERRTFMVNTIVVATLIILVFFIISIVIYKKRETILRYYNNRRQHPLLRTFVMRTNENGTETEKKIYKKSTSKRKTPNPTNYSQVSNDNPHESTTVDSNV